MIVAAATAEDRTSDRTRATRSIRFARRTVGWHLARPGRHEYRRLAGCGRWLNGSAEGEVTIRHRDEVGAYFDGLQTCASVWGCPVCAAKIRQKRAAEIGEAITAWHALGGGVELLSVTVRHGLGDDLADVLGAVFDGWGHCLEGRSWAGCPADCEAKHLGNCHGEKADGTPCKRRTPHRHRGLGHCDAGIKARHHIAGMVRTVEATYGHANGWHPHVHAVVFTDTPWTGDQRAQFEGEFFDQWAHNVAREAGEQYRPERGPGIDVTPVPADAAEAVAAYVVEQDDHLRTEGLSLALRVGMELTRHDLKEGKRLDRFTVFQVLDAAADGFGWAVNAWHSWVESTFGKHATTWSGNVRQRLALAEEVTDDEAANEDLHGEVVTTIPGPVWSKVLRRLGLNASLLDAAERGGALAVAETLALGLLAPARPEPPGPPT